MLTHWKEPGPGNTVQLVREAGKGSPSGLPTTIQNRAGKEQGRKLRVKDPETAHYKSV